MIGTGFGIVGIALIAYGFVRQRRVEEAIAAGGYAPLDARAGLFFAAVGVVLGVGTILVILFESS